MEPDKLIKLGGRRWSKGGHDRIYFNDLNKIIKLTVQPHYPDVYIHPKHRMHSTLNGKQIDVKEAETIYETCRRAKFWYDIKKEKFMSDGLYCHGYDIKQMLIDSVNGFLGDNEFTEILADFDDI